MHDFHDCSPRSTGAASPQSTSRPEYCEVANWLNDAVGLADLIAVRAADVTELPFDAASFDVVISQLRYSARPASPPRTGKTSPNRPRTRCGHA
jgi:hypothetical protein